ncbi:MAG TPA: 4Fe-4S binding protein [Candidatus Pacearchaeota archaeon]|nr:4Fe-4S binding protein [Candidatus Pacearchaeota archaeon]
MKEYKVNKEKCIGCGTCAAICGEGTEMEGDKAKVISSAKVEECGGEELCPYEAIEEINGVELRDDDNND